MTVALFTHPACLGHEAGPGHPECPDRLRAVLAALGHRDFTDLLREEAPLATREQLALVHPPAYIDQILSIRPSSGRVALDGDTLMSAGSADAALRAAGGAVAAVDAVMTGWARAAFAAVRPPGHHAEAAQAMGFCLFSTAAIAARHAQARWALDRIAVIDFDVHHGNGTQDVLSSDPAMFYASSHQSPCYPGTGSAAERGAAHNVLNLPLPPGADGQAFRRAWDRVGLPALHAFAPQIVIVSAGFDAHRADPLAELLLETEDFGWITDRLVDLADTHAGGRIASVLEGGYDLTALAAASALHVRRLMRI